MLVRVQHPHGVAAIQIQFEPTDCVSAVDDSVYAVRLSDWPSGENSGNAKQLITSEGAKDLAKQRSDRLE